MKIKGFSMKRNDNKSYERIERLQGGYEKLVETRKKELPQIEEQVQKMFENYNGEVMAVIRIYEDENGDPEAGETFIGGVSGAASSMALAAKLDEAGKHLRKVVKGETDTKSERESKPTKSDRRCACGKIHDKDELQSAVDDLIGDIKKFLED